ncbi:DUF4303 domain-containing protein [Chryseobacterium sp. ERMR1:04]|uniref:DUF4303 domain-containing protein n=1 Tax=Chryseobacterium sp. ERMR1:04 TaxID=1705393 RepID=UPI0006C8E32F|nr:DUF4303 domain-containing protein [Chryseobacterium sp. ERMR1:04]KPH14718.1 hypothetical protein AMQ68_04515 [Chryseobacterium sp. ERMR1:04]
MNFEILQQSIEKATKKAFLEIFNAYGSDSIYAFALYSDEGAMTVCPSTNTLKHLDSADQEDLTYYKFEPAEWKYEMQGADQEFNEIGNQLRAELDKNEEDNEWFLQFQKTLYDTCINVLEKLKNENFFKQITGKEIFLTFTVSEYEFENNDIKNIINRLNDNEYNSEYLDWMKTWRN